MYGPVKDISAVGISRGLSEDWYSSDSTSRSNRTEIKKGNFWDIIDNPLYEAAAGAAGYDWDAWVNEAKGKVGTGPNDGTTRVRATIKAGTPTGRRKTGTKKGGGFTYTDHPGTPAEYEWMTVDEAKSRGLDYQAAKTTRWRNTETGEIVSSRPQVSGPRQGATPFEVLQWQAGGGATSTSTGDWEELRDWGVHDEGIAEDLDGMNRWLTDIININDHLHPIIREGPKGEHYGIEGDIWEHYGLDQEPEPPKELDWDSYEKKMNLKVADKSTRTYSTPTGIQPIDLHGTDTDYSRFKE